MRRAWLASTLALAACAGGIYFSDFTVDTAEPGYTARAQFDDIKRYALERGLHVTGEGRDFAKFELDPANSLEMRIDGGRVQLTLARISSGEGYTEREKQEFQDALEARLRERTGHIVRVRFAGDRERPRSNVTFPGGFP
jgi:hypothetical protein